MTLKQGFDKFTG